MGAELAPARWCVALATVPQSDAMALYLSELAPSSRATVTSALRTVLREGGGLAGGAAELGELARRLPWHELSYPALLGLRRWCLERWTASRTNLVLAAIRGAARHALLLGELSQERHARVMALRSARPARRPLSGRYVTPAERDRLFAGAGRGALGARDRALLACLYSGGPRVGTVAALDLEHVDLDARELIARHKGGDVARVPLVTHADAYLRRWLQWRGQQPGPLLYRLRRGGLLIAQRVTTAGLRHAVAALCARADVAPCTPHDLRRTFASDALDRTRDLTATQAVLGHRDPATTARYDRRGERAQRAVCDALALPPPPDTGGPAED